MYKPLIIILILAALLRFYGLNWDQGQHLHPDERFLTMVATDISWPNSLAGYFDTNNSSLNPHNQGFNFFVYGTFPLFFTKLLAETFGYTDYDKFTLLGRAASGFFDLLTIIFIFLIARKIFSKSTGLLAAFFYSVSVLPIQLSHFFAVDTFLNFFLTATIYLLIKTLKKPDYFLAIPLGAAFGLALASKVTAVLLIPSIFIAFLFLLSKKMIKILPITVIFFLSTLIIFRIAQPYAFSSTSFFDLTINQKFINNLEELSNLSKPDASFPPAVQWNNTTPLLYPLKELIFWGIGLPLSITVIFGFIFFIIKIFRNFTIAKFSTFNLKFQDLSALILMIFIITVSIHQGIQSAKPLRYFLLIYPSLIILASSFIFYFYNLAKKNNHSSLPLLLLILLISISLLWPAAFMSIYTRPHSRVTASFWIYQNIPPGAVLSTEPWDDALPLNLSPHTYNIYNLVELPLVGPDSEEKWSLIRNKLEQIDYIIITSNRLYGSVNRIPKLYPETTNYYQKLFDGSLGFQKIAEFASRPNLNLPFINLCLTLPGDYGTVAKKIQECNLPGITIVDDYIDEASTVYDHPKVLIFKKVSDNNLFVKM